MPSRHALLGASSAYRWLVCTAAPRMEERFTDKSSSFAIEGTLAHAICEKKLKTFLGMPTDEVDKEIEELKEYYREEMQETSDLYVTEVLSAYKTAQQTTKDAKLFVEVELDTSDYIPEGFGTCDAVVIADGVMSIFDYKHGKGVEVSAELDELGRRRGNPQMKIYALGALRRYEDEYDIRDVEMTIVQPRINNISSYRISANKLRIWGEMVLLPIARKAYSGDNTSCVVCKGCGFCKAKAVCKALADKANDCVERDPNTIDPDELPHLLDVASVLDGWVSAVKQYALDKAMSGESIKGYKVVEGRSNRVIKDADALSTRLIGAGFSEIWRPKELLTLTNLEKLVGKKPFAQLAEGLVEKPQGAPTLVPESDKRAPLSVSSISNDFGDIND